MSEGTGARSQPPGGSGVEPGGPRVAVDASRCTGCGQCVYTCPTDVFRLQAAGADGAKVALPVYPGDCCDCFLCQLDCPANCITINFAPSGHGFKSIYERMGIQLPDISAAS